MKLISFEREEIMYFYFYPIKNHEFYEWNLYPMLFKTISHLVLIILHVIIIRFNNQFCIFN